MLVAKVVTFRWRRALSAEGEYTKQETGKFLRAVIPIIYWTSFRGLSILLFKDPPWIQKLLTMYLYRDRHDVKTKVTNLPGDHGLEYTLQVDCVVYVTFPLTCHSFL
jgi:hypothetical protein